MVTKQTLLGLLLLLLPIAANTQNIETLSAAKDISINDYTGTLSSSDINEIRNKLSAFHDETGSQIAVMFISTLDADKTLEQMSYEMATDLGIGRKDIDDGIFVLVVKNDRLVRIEVGNGLEGAIPDILAKRVIDEYIVPNFRSGNFSAGITSAIDALALLIRGEKLPAPVTPVVVMQDYESQATGIVLCTLAFFIFLMVAVFVKKWWIYTIIGLSVAAATWYMSSFGFAVAVAGMALFWKLISLFAGKGGYSGSGYSGSSYTYSSGTSYSSGSSYSGGSSSGGGSSGGYSGGGGSFSGGGASGSW